MSPATAIDSLRPRFLPDRDAVLEWGGKGAPLALLIRKGFAVPPSAAMGLNQVQGWLETLPEYEVAIEAWRHESAEMRTRLSALERAILGAPMPAHWPLSAGTLRQLLCGDPAELKSAEDEADTWPMILRSSMNAEDVISASLAGCFESVVVRETTAENLWRGYTQVVASAFRPASAERLLASGVDPRKFRAGVLIQPHLNAELAGVCFSRDILNPWSQDGCIEWVRGNGESLVQGTAESSQRRQSEGPAPELAPFWGNLWQRARKAESIVGGPADLEWVWDGAQLWIVQARPIATEEARLAARAPSRRWTRGLTLERFPEPLTPMGWSVLQDAFASNLKTLDRRFGVVAKRPEDMAVAVRGTVYSDPKFFAFPSGVRVRWGKHLNPLRAAPWLAAGAIFRFIGRVMTGRGGAVSRSLLGLDLIQALLGAEAQQIESGWADHRDESLARLKNFEPTVGKLKARLREGAQPLEAEVLDRMNALGAISVDFMEPDLAVYLIKDALNQRLLALCTALGWDGASFSDLLRGFEGNRTLEMNVEWKACLDALALDPAQEAFVSALESKVLQSETALGTQARAAWLLFLARNGHSTTSWDVALPSWGEAPSQLASLLRATLKARGVLTSGAGAASGKLREEKRAQLNEALKSRIGAVDRVQAALERLESFMRIDEEHHFLSGLLLVPSRELILLAGQLLTSRGLLAKADDAFNLSIGELKGALAHPQRAPSYKTLTAKRRSDWERARKSTPPFELPPSPNDHPSALGGADGALSWQGLPMSPGVVTGRAVVAEHLDQIRDLEPGVILVTTSPNPALTPLYPLLGGIVSTTGSSLSHGFVSAREYALPAVSGIRRATETIPHGAQVRIDGTTGRVEVLS